jgi:hypothetical protein
VFKNHLTQEIIKLILLKFVKIKIL